MADTAQLLTAHAYCRLKVIPVFQSSPVFRDSPTYCTTGKGVKSVNKEAKNKAKATQLENSFCDYMLKKGSLPCMPGIQQVRKHSFRIKAGITADTTIPFFFCLVD